MGEGGDAPDMSEPKRILRSLDALLQEPDSSDGRAPPAAPPPGREAPARRLEERQIRWILERERVASKRRAVAQDKAAGSTAGVE